MLLSTVQRLCVVPVLASAWDLSQLQLEKKRKNVNQSKHLCYIKATGQLLGVTTYYKRYAFNAHIAA